MTDLVLSSLNKTDADSAREFLVRSCVRKPILAHEGKISAADFSKLAVDALAYQDMDEKSLKFVNKAMDVMLEAVQTSKQTRLSCEVASHPAIQDASYYGDTQSQEYAPDMQSSAYSYNHPNQQHGSYYPPPQQQQQMAQIQDAQYNGNQHAAGAHRYAPSALNGAFRRLPWTQFSVLAMMYRSTFALRNKTPPPEIENRVEFERVRESMPKIWHGKDYLDQPLPYCEEVEAFLANARPDVLDLYTSLERFKRALLTAPQMDAYMIGLGCEVHLVALTIAQDTMAHAIPSFDDVQFIQEHFSPAFAIYKRLLDNVCSDSPFSDEAFTSDIFCDQVALSPKSSVAESHHSEPERQVQTAKKEPKLVLKEAQHAPTSETVDLTTASRPSPVDTPTSREPKKEPTISPPQSNKESSSGSVKKSEAVAELSEIKNVLLDLKAKASKPETESPQSTRTKRAYKKRKV